MSGVGFLFSGQLAEVVGMGRDFWESDPAARDLFARTSARCGRDLERILFQGPEKDLHENLAAQAGVYLVSTLAARALEMQGVRPAATAGYSLGNYAALVAAGAISYEDALDVLVAVWRETERLGIHGSMGAVVGSRRETVDEVCADAARTRAARVDRKRERLDPVRADGPRRKPWRRLLRSSRRARSPSCASR